MRGAGTPSRRAFLSHALVVLSGSAALSCRNKEKIGFACSDVGGLPEADVAVRTAMAYADHATDAAKECGRCVQFMGTYDGCGACKVIRGPIHPKGTCKIFAASG